MTLQATGPATRPIAYDAASRSAALAAPRFGIARRFLLTALLLGAGCAGAWLALARPTPGIDDASIFLVYARNIADGAGWVYNQGGEHVEGTTSFLWTLISAVAFLVSSRPQTALLAFSVVITAAAMTSLARAVTSAAVRDGYAERASGFGWALTLLLVASPGWVVWTTLTLMDTALWAALLMWATAVLISPTGTGGRPRAGAALTIAALLLLTRPESLLLVPAFAVLFSVRLLHHGVAPRRAAASLAAVGALSVSVVGGLTAFRLWYFGFPLPNTYYAKVSPSLGYNLAQGARYAGEFFLEGWVPPLAAILAVAGLALRAQMIRRLTTPGRARWTAAFGAAGARVTACGLWALATLLPPVLTGGDHFAMHRQLVPAMAPLFTVALLVVASLRVEHGLRLDLPVVRVAMPLAVAAAFVTGYGQESWPMFAEAEPGKRTRHEFELATEGVATGQAFSAILGRVGPLPTVGVITAGGFKYEYPGEVVDLMGLNDVRMGHSSTDRRGMKNHAAFSKPVFYELRPQALLPAPLEGDGTRPDLAFDRKVLHGLLSETRFIRNWTYLSITARDEGGSSGIRAFFTCDLAARLERHPGLVVRRVQISRVPACTG